MKSIKMISIDSELMLKLKSEENASGLIEKLVREHYEKAENKYKGMSKEQLAIERRKAEILYEAQKKIEELGDGADKQERT